MVSLRRIIRRLSIFFRSDRLEREMDEELRTHLEMEIEDNLRTGMEPEEARRRAMIAFGGVERFKQQAREARGGKPLADLGQDLRFAARTLAKAPLFTLATVLVLGLGIGASTATFSVVNGVVLKPLPYPEPDDLLALWMTDDEDGDLEVPWSYPSFFDVDTEQESFSSITAWEWVDATLTGSGDPTIVYAVGVSSGMLGTLGVQPLLGRDIQPEETVQGGPLVTVLSHRLWQERFGGDENVLTTTIQLSNRTYQIVGVAPPDFAYPRGAALWVPGEWSEETHDRGRHFLRVLGRLRPDVALETAQAELSGIASRLEEEYPESNEARGIHLVTLKEETVGDIRMALLVLLGAVGMVLLIACANVANLLLVRGAARTREVAVRATLGASRAAILRLLLSESGLLAVLGGGLGVVLAHLGVRAVVSFSPGRLPRISEIAVDGTTLLFALGLVGFVALLVGVVPAVRLASRSIASVIREGRENRLGIGGKELTRSGLLTVEIALSLVLLLGAGLLFRSFVEARGVEMGFDAENVQSFTLTLPDAAYDDASAVQFQEELHRRIAELPGVQNVGLINGSPLGRSHTTISFEYVDQEASPDEEEPVVLVRRIGPGYFETLGIPLLHGRDFRSDDRMDNERVAVISALAASRYWPGQDPIGRRFNFDPQDPDQPTWTVVGVAGDVRSVDVTTEAWPEAYFPLAQWPRKTVTAVVRADPELPGLVPTLRQTVNELDPALPLYYVEALEDRMAVYLASDRFYLFFLAVSAGLAMVLSAVGLYGVVAYLVSKRTQEIGIRVALGASRQEVMRLVLGQGIGPVVLGTAVGLGVALAGGRLMASLLYQVEPWDPLTLAGGTVVLLAVAVAATLLPARNATRIPPTEAMRVE
jgi:putative ABC transport system permease protein